MQSQQHLILTFPLLVSHSPLPSLPLFLSLIKSYKVSFSLKLFMRLGPTDRWIWMSRLDFLLHSSYIRMFLVLGLQCWFWFWLSLWFSCLVTSFLHYNFMSTHQYTLQYVWMFSELCHEVCASDDINGNHSFTFPFHLL